MMTMNYNMPFMMTMNDNMPFTDIVPASWELINSYLLDFEPEKYVIVPNSKYGDQVISNDLQNKDILFRIETINLWDETTERDSDDGSYILDCSYNIYLFIITKESDGYDLNIYRGYGSSRGYITRIDILREYNYSEKTTVRIPLLSTPLNMSTIIETLEEQSYHLINST